MKKLFILIFILTLFTNFHAEASTFEGGVSAEGSGHSSRIVDKNTGNGIENATISLPKQNYSTKTDANGYFELNTQIDGATILSVQKDKYKPFSATITPNVEDIIKLSMKNYESVKIKSDNPTVSRLEQGFIQIEADKKFLFLFTFIKKNPKKKMLIFFATCKEVEYFASLLNYVDVPVLSITGEYKQQKRSTTYMEFCGMDNGILLCTDVAQRGLDIPDVSHIIHYHLPTDEEAFTHRNGRTARAGGSGCAYLIVGPNEFIPEYLKKEPNLYMNYIHSSSYFDTNINFNQFDMGQQNAYDQFNNQNMNNMGQQKYQIDNVYNQNLEKLAEIVLHSSGRSGTA